MGLNVGAEGLVLLVPAWGSRGESHLGRPWRLANQWWQWFSSWVIASRAVERVDVANARGHGVPAGEDLGVEGDVVMVR
jgi:hypothetical protein